MTQKQITDIKIGSNSVIKAMLNNEKVWPYEINTEDYMTIEILEDDSYINLEDNTGYELDIDKENYIYYFSVLDGYSYCINGDGIWISNFYQDYNTPKLKAGDKVSFKRTMSYKREIAPKFNVYRIVNNEVVEATFNLSGNCMSLIYGDDAKNHYSLLEHPYAFNFTFYSSKVINVSPNFLPATTLAKHCYDSMFTNCTSLTEAPELPATTLAEYCYNGMFTGCESLKNAPELPATTLANNCYGSMFSSCTSLVNAPELPATTLAGGCYGYMFTSCTSLVNAPELPATTLAGGCYLHMFMMCTSLTEAPELPATTLAGDCYYEMFLGCESLTVAPVLPATTLVECCYNRMFLGCSALSSITALFDSFGDTSLNATTGWLSDVAEGGVFTMNSNATWNPEDHRGSSGVPETWSVVYY